MKQLVILSGKGGTGKTSISAAFQHLFTNPKCTIHTVVVDADVDAANLSLLLKPCSSETNDFWGGSLADIDAQKCNGCGACVTVCRYDAILTDIEHEPAFRIDPIACDGCAACIYVCPENAIHMIPQQEGNWFHSKTPYGDLFHAELFPGKENSGKMVTLVKQQARFWAEETNNPLVIIDGPPGIGCPVISACAGADQGLIVTEPSLAALHDLKRILGTLQHFKIPAVICINKADIYPQGTEQIRKYADEQGIEVLGEIPYDEHIPRAMIEGIPVTHIYPESPASESIRQIWKKILIHLHPELVIRR